jgi:hypothetical protein
MKYCILLFSIFLVASCGSFKQTNFNRQKFTDLKSTKTNSVNDQIETRQAKTPNDPTHDATNSDSSPDYSVTPAQEPIKENYELVTEKENRPNEKFTRKNSAEKNKSVKTEKGKVTLVDSSKVDNKIVLGNRRDFEKLSQHDQNQSVLTFNRIFNAGLLILLISILFLLGGLLFVPAAAVAIPLIFSLWIMSFVALNKVRRIDLSDQPKRLKTKVRLAQLVCGIGVAVCIVTLLGGIVLLILWLARVI